MTLLDGAVRPELCGGLAELAKGLWLRKACPERSRRDDLDEERLMAYVRRLGHKAAARRISFLLETLRAEPQGEAYGLGRPETIAALQSFTNRRYALLDPTLPAAGPYRARWRLRVNLDPEELKAIVWT